MTGLQAGRRIWYRRGGWGRERGEGSSSRVPSQFLHLLLAAVVFSAKADMLPTCCYVSAVCVFWVHSLSVSAV